MVVVVLTVKLILMGPFLKNQMKGIGVVIGDSADMVITTLSQKVKTSYSGGND